VNPNAPAVRVIKSGDSFRFTFNGTLNGAPIFECPNFDNAVAYLYKTTRGTWGISSTKDATPRFESKSAVKSPVGAAFRFTNSKGKTMNHTLQVVEA